MKYINYIETIEEFISIYGEDVTLGELLDALKEQKEIRGE